MNYWLLKTEPSEYSWERLIKEKEGLWDGVRNHQARINLQKMKKGDRAFIYHTGDEKAVIGIAVVSLGPFPEPGSPEWTSVKIQPEKKLKNPVTLTRIKAEKKLTEITLVKMSRLSVHALTKEVFDHILKLSQE